MNKIIRTKTRAAGGITAEEELKMTAVAKEWAAVAMRTTPIDPAKIIPAIEKLYAAAQLKKPRIVIVPSPLVMAFAYGASAAIWHGRGTAATDDATCTATDAATDAVTRAVTCTATDAATDAATRAVTYAATDAVTRAASAQLTSNATTNATYVATTNATYVATSMDIIDAAYEVASNTTANTTANAADAAKACLDLAGSFGLECAKRWKSAYQGGNMWSAWCSYLVAARDVLGLDLPEYSGFAAYEQAAREGGFRVMHPEFCLVCDFPEIIKKDEQNRPHCEDGPSHRWRDGWSLYHWHGVKVPAEWIENKTGLSAKTALALENSEQRRVACEIIGWTRVLEELSAKVIDQDDDPEIGTLLEVDLPGSGKERFLRVLCGTGREFALPVSKDCGDTAMDAQAWTWGLSARDFKAPEVRT